MASLGHLRAGRGVREAVVKLASQSNGTIKVGLLVFFSRKITPEGVQSPECNSSLPTSATRPEIRAWLTDHGTEPRGKICVESRHLEAPRLRRVFHGLEMFHYPLVSSTFRASSHTRTKFFF